MKLKYFFSPAKVLSSVSDQVREMVKEYEHKYTEVLYHHVQEEGLDQPHTNIQDSITDLNTNSDGPDSQFSSTTAGDANHSVKHLSPDQPNENPHQHKSVILETGHEMDQISTSHRGEHIAGYTHEHRHADHDGHLHVEQPQLDGSDEENPGGEEHAHVQHQHQHLDGSLHAHLLPIYTSSQEEQVGCGGQRMEMCDRPIMLACWYVMDFGDINSMK